jgi:microcin C transport system permease protein
VTAKNKNSIYYRRWNNFKKNKRGFYSLIIFTVLFFISLFAELVANDKPWLVYTNNKIYFPILRTYSEKDFGGELELAIDYRHKYATDLIKSQSGWIIWAPIKYSYDTINYNSVSPAPPSGENLLGTDDQGRDVLARVIYGFRISIFFGVLLTALSSIVGISVGALQGYYGGRIDLLGQRFIEIWSGMPSLFLLIILSSFVETNFWWLLGITLLFKWMSLVDIVRAEFLRCRNFEYVRAAKSIGVSDIKIMFRHILPNALVSTLTLLPFLLTSSITTLTSLDFLGFGLPSGSPSLGELIAQGKNNLQSPWLGITAFMTMSIMLTLLVFIGEACRDAFDPRKYYSEKR